MRSRTWLMWLGSALMIGGAGLLAGFLWTQHESAEAQKRAREWLQREKAEARKTFVVPRLHPARVVRGAVIGELAVPRLRLSVAVFEGDDAGILRLGAGHIPQTALPPGSGNIGIAAHRDTFFRPLRGIQPRDTIILETPAGTLHFTVTDTEIVRPTDIGVLAKAPGRDLTLVTCYPFYYLGSAPKRFVVHARKTG